MGKRNLKMIILMLIIVSFFSYSTSRATFEVKDGVTYIKEVTESKAIYGTGSKFDPSIADLEDGVCSYSVNQVMRVPYVDDNGVVQYEDIVLDNKEYPLSEFKMETYKDDMPDYGEEMSSDEVKKDLADKLGQSIYGELYTGSEEQIEEINSKIFAAQQEGYNTIVSRNLDMPTTRPNKVCLINPSTGEVIARLGDNLDLSYSVNEKTGEVVASELLQLLIDNPNYKLTDSKGATVISSKNLQDLIKRLGEEQHIIHDRTDPPKPKDDEDPDEGKNDPFEDYKGQNDNSALVISPDGCAWTNVVKNPMEVTVYAAPAEAKTSISIEWIGCTCHTYNCSNCNRTGLIECGTCDGNGGWMEDPAPYKEKCSDLCDDPCEADHTVDPEPYWRSCPPKVQCDATPTHNHPDGGTKLWIFDSGKVTPSIPEQITQEGRYTKSYTAEFSENGYIVAERNLPYVIISEPDSYILGKTSNPFHVDNTAPKIFVSGGTFDKWVNTDVEFYVSADDSNGSIEVSGLGSLVPSGLVKIEKEGKTTTTINAADRTVVPGPNTSTLSKTVYIDKTAPVIAFNIENNNLVYNTKLERWESTTDAKPFFKLLAKDPIPAGLTETDISDMASVKYLVYNDDMKDRVDNLDFISIPLTTENKNALKQGTYKIDISEALLIKGGNVYLSVVVEDNAGNVASTNNYGKLGNDVSPKDSIVPDDYYKIVKFNNNTTPIGNIFVNTTYPDDDDDGGGDEGNESALHITNVNDVKWKHSLDKDVPISDMAVYMNRENDTIGFGYAVGFKFGLKGFGLEDNDKVVLRSSIYGKVGNEYKKLTKIKVNGKFTNEFFEKEFIKKANTTDNSITKASDLLTRPYAFRLEPDNVIKSLLFFNYYIPANAKLYYEQGGNNIEFKGEQIVVVFDFDCYKWYDLEDKKFVYTYSKDPRVKRDSNKGITNTTSFVGRKRIEDLDNDGIVTDERQVFWYDLVNTAVTDIQGERHY